MNDAELENEVLKRQMEFLSIQLTVAKSAIRQASILIMIGDTRDAEQMLKEYVNTHPMPGDGK